MNWEFYDEKKKELFANYKYKLICSKNYRRLDGKTQLFSSDKGDHFRNRMIHTAEVREIAVMISNKINEEFVKNYNEKIINTDLVECIAIAHDFGHTPFGHIGERTLQQIVSNDDLLGGLLCKNTNRKKLFFKHNINSLRLLVEEFGKGIPWEILDGVLKHSKLSYNKDQDNGVSNIISGIEYDKIFYKFKESKNPLTIEGQIVAIADEVAQRYSDFEDTFRAKNINILKKQISIMQIDLSDYEEERCIKYIDRICSNLIESIVKQSIYNLENIMKNDLFNHDFIEVLSNSIVITFDSEGVKLNNTLEYFIKECIFNIDELRKIDEKNKYVIRQLFKAYYNNCFQITGEYFTKFIKKLNKLKNKLVFNDDTKEKYCNLLSISFVNGNKIDYKKFDEFITELKKVDFDLENKDENLTKLFFEYIRLIVFYIASMTDKYALDCYKFLYEV